MERVKEGCASLGKGDAETPRSRVVTWAGPGWGGMTQAETGRQLPTLGEHVPLGFQARLIVPRLSQRVAWFSWSSLASSILCPAVGPSQCQSPGGQPSSQQEQNPD